MPCAVVCHGCYLRGGFAGSGDLSGTPSGRGHSHYNEVTDHCNEVTVVWQVPLERAVASGTGLWSQVET